MKDLGTSLSAGINSFAKGMALGEQWKSRMDDDAWNAEVKNRQRSEWKASDDLRAKQAQAQQLQAAYEAIQSGIDIDPAPILESMRNAGQFGASVAQHFAEPDKMQGWLTAADQVMQTGQGSPEALEALNWRLQDQINKGVGEELKQPVALDDAHVIPAGSKIVGKRISQVIPAGRKGPGGKFTPKEDGGLYFGLDVEVETPDGKRMTYPAPATVGRDSSPDAQILEVPLDNIFDLVEADRLVMSDVQRDPKFAGALRSMILASGGKVPAAPKRDEFKREIGGEIVTFQRMPDGTEKEVARAPRWNPSPGAGATESYQFLPTDQGYMVGNRRTGGIAAPEGERPIMPAQFDPQTQGAVAAAKAEGTAKGKYAGSEAKVKSTLTSQAAKVDRLSQDIDKAIGMVGGMTSGLTGSVLSKIPGTEAKDLQRIIDTIKANIGFAELSEMRANSPTGGALGNVTERELAFLQSVIASLEQDQTPEQLKGNLQNVKRALIESLGRMQEAYQVDFGEGQAEQQPAAPTSYGPQSPPSRPPLSSFER